MIQPPLDISKLKALAHNLWIEKDAERGNTAVWYQAVLGYLGGLGGIFVPKEVIQLERVIVERGWAKEYLTQLGGCSEEPDNIRSFEIGCLASVDDRLKGIDYILTKHPEVSLFLPRYLKLYLSTLKA